MNILYICTPTSIHDQKWMRYFAEKEEFNVFAVGESKIDESTFYDLKKQNINLLPSIDSFSIKTPYKNHQSIQKLRKYCELYKIDLVHVLFATPYALWVNCINTPYMITTRGSDVLVVLPELKEQKGVRGIYFSWLFKKFQKAFSSAKAITCTSELQQKRIKELFGLKADVIRTGVDVEKIVNLNPNDYLPSELKGVKYIFSPRFMSPIYNISFQIEALAFLPKSITENYAFVFVKGKQFNPQYFEEQLKSLQQLGNINYIILDYLSQEALWATFKRAALTIMTPISDGTPNSALEAMAAGSPLIVSDLPYDKDLFENTCVKTSLKDPKVLAQLIENTLENPNEFKQEANDAVYKFGNRASEMQKLEKLYQILKSQPLS